MFTAHEIVDIAIQLENNGEKTYRDAANCTSDRELKKLLDWVMLYRDGKITYCMPGIIVLILIGQWYLD